VLSNIKPGQEETTFRSVYGDVAYTLPYVKEIEPQFYSAGLLDAVTGKDAKKYNAEIKNIVVVVVSVWQINMDYSQNSWSVFVVVIVVDNLIEDGNRNE
jgi:hypothetical protein